jgi:hypothetical protein
MKRIGVAHVGHVDVADDAERWRTVLQWLQANDKALHDLLYRPDSCEADFIDLNRTPPRDFLAEHSTYDVVITHHLWGEMIEGYTTRLGGAAQSPHHSIDAWRRRLAETQAAYIFLAGGAFNIGTLGGHVPGYEIVDFMGRWYTTILRSSAKPRSP